MGNEINIPLTVENWAEMVIKKWVIMAKTLEIHPDDPLTDDRFKYFLTVQADGNIERITFTYDFYLKFVNWGVGRGVFLKDRDSLVAAGITRRKKKPWYDNVFPGQLALLSHLLSERYAGRTVALVKSGLEIKPSGGTNTIPGSSSPRTPIKSKSNGPSYSEFQKTRKDQGW